MFRLVETLVYRGSSGAAARVGCRPLFNSDPSGGSHHSLNCSIAELAVEHEGATLATAHGGVYKLGMRERGPGVAVAPYPDPEPERA